MDKKMLNEKIPIEYYQIDDYLNDEHIARVSGHGFYFSPKSDDLMTGSSVRVMIRADISPNTVIDSLRKMTDWLERYEYHRILSRRSPRL